MRRVVCCAALVAALSILCVPSVSWATNVFICVPETSGSAVVSGGTTSGNCAAKTTQVQMPSKASEQEALISILPYIKFETKGVDGKPTIIVSEANLEVNNGASKTSTVNGTGNIVLGYDENKELKQTGSHNLILGSEQTYETYGSILGGSSNTDTNNGSDAFLAGTDNIVEAVGASVGGGKENNARGLDASITGGKDNKAEAAYSGIGGGNENTTRGELSYIAGGMTNVTKGSRICSRGGMCKPCGRRNVTCHHLQ